MIQRPPLLAVLMCLALIGPAPTAAIVLFQDVTNTADSGAGSLRSAILSANASPSNPTEIRFNIPGDGPFTIRPLTGLPDIFATVFILGNSQPGTTTAPLIEIDGGMASGFASGLTIQSDGSLVRGLTIGNFPVAGILITEASRVTVEGCRLGTDIDGVRANPNSIGLSIISSTQCRIGGPGASEGNLISGNGDNGVLVAGTLARDNEILGNLIGTDVSGIAPLGNGDWGIQVILGANATNIGGPQPGAGNVIAANGSPGSNEPVGGITLSGTDHRVRGNLIGLGRDGTTPLGNTERGIFLDGALDCLIGGPTSPERNVIADSSTGIAIREGSTRTLVRGNFIGTDVTGTEERPNLSGIFVQDATDTVIGGTGAGEGNLLSGNRGPGIALSGDVVGTVIQGNLIGTDVTGLRALGNSRGVGTGDVSGDVLIGGPGGGRNVIASNRDFGILINTVTTGRTQILDNLIGVGTDGVTPLGNVAHGIDIRLFGDVMIGSPSAGNIIAHSGETGVRSPSRSGVTIRGNRIFANAGLGIDRGAEGVTPNDDESDDAPNFPLISGAAFTPTGLSVSGAVDTVSNADITVDFYLSPTCDASGHGEGWEPIATLSLTTSAGGTASFNEMFITDPAIEGRYLTATSTDPNGDTSEFSPCIRAIGRGPSAHEIVDFLLGLIPDPGDLNLNSDGAVNSADLVTSVNASPE